MSRYRRHHEAATARREAASPSAIHAPGRPAASPTRACALRAFVRAPVGAKPRRRLASPIAPSYVPGGPEGAEGQER